MIKTITIVIVLCVMSVISASACDDCSFPSDFDSYELTRSKFWVDKDMSGDFQVRSMDRKYEHWPSEYFPHILIIWTRYPDGKWHLNGPVGKGPGITLDMSRAARIKSEDLRNVIDEVHPTGVVSFSYMMMLHEAVIYLGEEGIGSVKDRTVYEKLRDNLNIARGK